MNEPSASNPNGSSVWRGLARRRLLLLPESLWFLAVSVGDVVLTYLLLATTGHEDSPFRVGESNPVAGYILDHWGVRRLIYFKFATVALVIAIAEFVEAKKPKVGHAILRFGTLVVGCVVVYSLILWSLSRPVS
ncbi:MAG: DUF5658 family protein [Planctomycetales bacterium]